MKMLVAELTLLPEAKKNIGRFGIQINQYMKYTQSEKMEIIRMVEESSLSVKQTLRELDVPRSSFYEWYSRYKEAGYDGLPPSIRASDRCGTDPGVGKRTSPRGRQEHPEKSCREIAWLMTDKMSSFISESSVYRILKAYDLITSRVSLVWPKISSSTRHPDE